MHMLIAAPTAELGEVALQLRRSLREWLRE
jgi:hypothetical protein